MSDTRWVATAQPDGKGWKARPEFYRATEVMHHMVCKHHHKTQRAALDCAKAMVGSDQVEERIAL